MLSLKPIIQSRPKRIAIDIDEVLMPFAKPMFKWGNIKPITRKYPYNYAVALGITEKESRDLVYGYYESDEFINTKPICGASYVLGFLKSLDYDIYAVTGRQNRVRDKTEMWLDHHFPYIFKDVILTNSYTLCEVNKEDICKSLAIQAIVDDNLSICQAAESQHIKGINFIGYPTYEWCTINSLSVNSWLDVMDTFREGPVPGSSAPSCPRISKTS